MKNIRGLPQDSLSCSVTVSAGTEMIAITRACLCEIAASLGLESRCVYDLKLALNEACVSLMEYLHRQSGHARAMVEFRKNAQQFEIRLGREEDSRGSAENGSTGSLVAPSDHMSVNRFLLHSLMDEVIIEDDTERGLFIRMIKYLAVRPEGVIDNASPLKPV